MLGLKLIHIGKRAPRQTVLAIVICTESAQSPPIVYTCHALTAMWSHKYNTNTEGRVVDDAAMIMRASFIFYFLVNVSYFLNKL